jgi:hypothetical protein
MRNPASLQPGIYDNSAIEHPKLNGGGAEVLPKFKLHNFADIKVDTKERNYIVKGLLPRSGIVVVWGPPKSYKSFWIMDVLLHTALAWEYRGRKVQQAEVVYIALEGRNGIPGRVEAFKIRHAVTEAPFHLVTQPLDLVADADDLIASIKEQTTKPGVVCLDTLNRSLVGSESKDEDSRIATSVGSSLLGLGGDLIVIDDPHDVSGVESEADRETVWRWFSEVSSTRRNDPKNSAVVVVMQRLHELDVSGRILADSPEGDWTHFCVPAEFEAARCCQTGWQTDDGFVTWTDPRGCDDETGEPLLTFPDRVPVSAEAQEILEQREGLSFWPERFGPAEIASLKASLGPYLAAGRLAQSPQPRGGGIIKTRVVLPLRQDRQWQQIPTDHVSRGEPRWRLHRQRNERSERDDGLGHLEATGRCRASHRIDGRLAKMASASRQSNTTDA